MKGVQVSTVSRLWSGQFVRLLATFGFMHVFHATKLLLQLGLPTSPLAKPSQTFHPCLTAQDFVEVYVYKNKLFHREVSMYLFFITITVFVVSQTAKEFLYMHSG